MKTEVCAFGQIHEDLYRLGDTKHSLCAIEKEVNGSVRAQTARSIGAEQKKNRIYFYFYISFKKRYDGPRRHLD